jgi:predicted TIM-barrel enzyme
VASISVETWAAVVTANAAELAAEVVRHSPMADVSVTAGASAVVVSGQALGSRPSCAWAAVVAVAPIWAESIPPTIGCVVVLGAASWRTSGVVMAEVARGADRAEWMRRVEVRIG